MPKVSVVLTTFNQPNALTFALLGYQRQTCRDFELVVADDGSDAETKAIVEHFQRASDFAIKHVWQENKGYRKAMIANAAVRVSTGSIVLLSDGDCIPHRDFVRVHAERNGPGRFCVGGYVRLSAEHCRTLTRENVAAGEFETRMTSADRWKFFKTHIRSVLGVWLGSPRKPKVYGCNISVDRDVFFAVNGYDENFAGFGKEDSDLRNRLRRYGAKPISLWGKAWVYHIDDVIDPKTRQRIPRTKNLEYYGRPNIPVRCDNGLVKDKQP